MNVKQDLALLPLWSFHWDKTKLELTAEASDFGPVTSGNWWLQRLYDDACDLGIAIQSHETNRVEFFCLTGKATDGEGDLLYWEFKPVDTQCRVKRVKVFND